MQTLTPRSRLVGWLFVAWLFLPAISWAELIACALIEGTSQGLIHDGDVSRLCPGMNEGIQILGFGQSLLVPTDPQSGQLSGQRQHRPLKLLKAVTGSSPLLNHSLVIGERLNEVKIQFYRRTQEGGIEHYYTIKLDDAQIVNVTTSATANEQTTALQELLSLVYRRITWTNEISGTEASDDWRAPPA